MFPVKAADAARLGERLLRRAARMSETLGCSPPCSHSSLIVPSEAHTLFKKLAGRMRYACRKHVGSPGWKAAAVALLKTRSVYKFVHIIVVISPAMLVYMQSALEISVTFGPPSLNPEA